MNFNVRNILGSPFALSVSAASLLVAAGVAAAAFSESAANQPEDIVSKDVPTWRLSEVMVNGHYFPPAEMDDASPGM